MGDLGGPMKSGAPLSNNAKAMVVVAENLIVERWWWRNLGRDRSNQLEGQC